ncbi:MAG: heavy-metal-associated domain-containing protein [Bacteroidota bacterium]
MTTTETIQIDNLKCGGCANTIRKQLAQLSGVKNVEVDVPTHSVSITHKGLIAKAAFLQKLAQLGYPEMGTTTTLQKAKSFVSCAIGRLS